MVAWLVVVIVVLLQVVSVESYLMLRRGLGLSSQRLRFSSQVDLLARLRDKQSPRNNIPESIVAKVGQNLHLRPHHPLNIIKTRYFPGWFGLLANSFL